MPALTVSPLDDRTQAFVNRLFDLHAEAEEHGQRLVAHGALALITGLHMSYEEQRSLSLLFHDLVELMRTAQARSVRLVPKTDTRNGGVG